MAMILLDCFRSMHVFMEDPLVIALRESFPLDQILEVLPSTGLPVVQDSFYFLFRFSIHNIQWGPGEVGPMFQSFLIW
jgi:hypothetical protein